MLELKKEPRNPIEYLGLVSEITAKGLRNANNCEITESTIKAFRVFAKGVMLNGSFNDGSVDEVVDKIVSDMIMRAANHKPENDEYIDETEVSAEDKAYYITRAAVTIIIMATSPLGIYNAIQGAAAIVGSVSNLTEEDISEDKCTSLVCTCVSTIFAGVCKAFAMDGGKHLDYTMAQFFAYVKSEGGEDLEELELIMTSDLCVVAKDLLRIYVSEDIDALKVAIKDAKAFAKRVVG